MPHQRTIPRVCEQCGDPFLAEACEVRAGRARYCSRVCAARSLSTKRRGPRRDLASRFWEKVEKGDGCWTWTARSTHHGYGSITVDGRSVRAHRLSYSMAYGPIPEGLVVCHHCDNPSCVRPDHLFLGTMADNIRDRDEKKRRTPPSGETNGFAKLTEAQVREIRHRYIPRRMSLSMLAREYGVSASTIHDVVRRERWRHVAEED